MMPSSFLARSLHRRSLLVRCRALTVVMLADCTGHPSGTRVGSSSSGCTPERGRTSAEIREGSMGADASRSSAARLVVLVREGDAPPASTPRPIERAIVQYRPSNPAVADGTDPWTGRLRTDAPGRYVADSLPEGRYTVRVRAIARRTMTYDISLRRGRADTLLVELAAASVCMLAPTDTTRDSGVHSSLPFQLLPGACASLQLLPSVCSM